MQPEQAQEPTSRLDALEHQINADHDPETGEVLDEGRSEEDTGEGPDLANAIADIDAAEIVVGVNSRLAEYEAHFTGDDLRSEEHTSELQSLMRYPSAVFCLKQNKYTKA